MSADIAIGEDSPLDDRIRGVPPGGETRLEGLHPAEGVIALPVLTLSLPDYERNRDAMMRYVREQGVAIAPHAKTPTAPVIAADLLAAGAWGTTVADIRQATVMARAGLTRLILANGVGGRGGARRLAAFIAAYPDVELYLFVDSAATAGALAQVWQATPALPPLRVLVEVGAARGGARDLAAAEAVIATVQASAGRLVLAGAAAYEGAVSEATPERTAEVQAGLLTLAGRVLVRVRQTTGDRRPLVLTAGGSVYFDRVVSSLRPVALADGATTLVLRSGAIFYEDHGTYRHHLAEMDARGGFQVDGRTSPSSAVFRPTMRVWAEVLSCPEPGLAICGMGKRDVSFDEGLPVALERYRDGAGPVDLTGTVRLTQLNDQHGFLALGAGADICVGDVVAFGLSHPCTAFQLYRQVLGLDANGRVSRVIPTFFG